MSSESNQWLALYEQIDQSLSGLAADYRQHQAPRLDGTTPDAQQIKEKRMLSRRVNTCRDEIKKLERDLAKMEAQPIAYKIGEGELSRRRGLITGLKTQLQFIIDLSEGKTTSRKKDLFSGWMDDTPTENDGTRGLSNRQLAEQQQLQFKRQDQKLDDVLEGVTKLKDIGTGISAEFDLQKPLLRELDENIDHTDAKLRINTQRVEQVNEKAGGCCGMITMVILAVIIVGLISSNIGCHVFKPSSC